MLRTTAPWRAFLAFVLGSCLLLVLPARASEELFCVDPGPSAVSFKVGQFGVPFVTGRFESFSGHYTIEGEKLAGFEGTVDLDSLDTGIKARDRDLKSAGFFDVARYPHMLVKAESFEQSGRHVELTADVTIRGISRPVHLTGTMDRQGARASLELQGALRRHEFGLRLNRFFEWIVGGDVKIILKLDGRTGAAGSCARADHGRQAPLS